MHNFNDHLNFSPNLYDNALIRKKLSEQLQEKINILEAGYSEAIRSGNKEKMEKELLRQKARKELKQEIARKGLPPGMERFDELDPEVKRTSKISFSQPYLNQFAAQSSIRDIAGNIESLAMQLDSEYPQAKRRIKVSELPAESPFGTDRGQPFTMHVTPQQY